MIGIGIFIMESGYLIPVYPITKCVKRFILFLWRINAGRKERCSLHVIMCEVSKEPCSCNIGLCVVCVCGEAARPKEERKESGRISGGLCVFV